MKQPRTPPTIKYSPSLVSRLKLALNVFVFVFVGFPVINFFTSSDNIEGLLFVLVVMIIDLFIFIIPRLNDPKAMMFSAETFHLKYSGAHWKSWRWSEISYVPDADQDTPTSESMRSDNPSFQVTIDPKFGAPIRLPVRRLNDFGLSRHEFAMIFNQYKSQHARASIAAPPLENTQANALLTQANNLFEDGEFAKAIQHYQEAIEVGDDPVFDLYYMIIGDCHRHLQQWQKAIAAYEKCWQQIQQALIPMKG